MKWNQRTTRYAPLCVLLLGQVGAWTKPATPTTKSAARNTIRWRIVKAETYTFRDNWNDQAMRAVRIWIDSPGYSPSINEVIPDDTEKPAHWQLTDEQGNSYVKDYYGLEILDATKRKTKTPVLEFTGVYRPIPAAKVGHIRLKFPLELRKSSDSQGDNAQVVQVDTLVTHHK